LHAQLHCPVLLVAEHADEVDEIVALELGADGYLARPLAARRLRAHVGALMRLHGPAPECAAVPATPVAPAGAGWQLDRVANRLCIEGHCIALTEVQAALLQCLAEARGRIVPRGRLAAALPHGDDLGTRSVDVYIHRLRARLRKVPAANRLAIEAVRGRGYVLSVAGRSDHNAVRDAA
jgi:DNA-binding response OmpR family regulator